MPFHYIYQCVVCIDVCIYMFFDEFCRLNNARWVALPVFVEIYNA